MPPDLPAQKIDLKSLLIVAGATLAAFIIAYWPALSNTYVINDDVRQQIFWMQSWADPELYQNDLLTEYARHYVPWGVKAVYYPFSGLINPVQFTKVVTGILFVVTGCFIYGLALGFRDRLTAYIAVGFFIFYAGFMRKISGGLSQSFAFPFLAAYLYFLSHNQIGRAATTAFLQTFFNPYIFILSATTQALYLIVNYGRPLSRFFRRREPMLAPDGKELSFGGLIVRNLPIVGGIAVMALEFLAARPADLGNLITKAQMLGKVEYTAAGRYKLIPIPSLPYELIRPWIFNLPYREWGAVAGWIVAALLIAAAVYGFKHWRPGIVSLKGFKVFGYVFPASVLFFAIACVFFMKFFVPRRYIEFTLYIFYCLTTAVLIRMVIEKLKLVHKSVLILAVFFIFSAIRLYHVGQFDYSKYKDLYQFVETVPKSAILAGHPELMDDVLTFGKRKAFVTYKLSHTWVEPYWSTIKQRTYKTFFDAYYSWDTPRIVLDFAKKHGINYMIVRESDFAPDKLTKGRIYFEPFKSYIQNLAEKSTDFVLLDRTKFPPIYEKDGVRVIKLDESFR